MKVMSVSNPHRQHQGAVNKAQGKLFESLIDISCIYYENKGTAVIEKTPEPMRPIKNLGNGRFLAHFEKKAQPDYEGVLKSGRSLKFEAKYTANDRLLQSKVTKHQTEKLAKFEKMGAACFVLVAFDRCGYYRIPWSVWRNMKAIFGRLYVKPTDLDKFEIPFKNGVLHFLDDIEWREQEDGTLA